MTKKLARAVRTLQLDLKQRSNEVESSIIHRDYIMCLYGSAHIAIQHSVIGPLGTRLQPSVVNGFGGNDASAPEDP